MKTQFALVLAALFLLSGCPDSKAPKAPPKVPEPKAETAAAPTPFSAGPTGHFA